MEIQKGKQVKIDFNDAVAEEVFQAVCDNGPDQLEALIQSTFLNLSEGSEKKLKQRLLRISKEPNSIRNLLRFSLIGLLTYREIYKAKTKHLQN